MSAAADNFSASDGIEIIDHTADWSIRVRAADLSGLLRRAAEGMALLMVGPEADTPADETRPLSIEAYDVEGLLVAWLGELAYLAEREQFVGCDFELMVVTETRLAAIVRGGTAAEFHKHIKAVTYHGLEVRATDSGLEATIVFDV